MRGIRVLKAAAAGIAALMFVLIWAGAGPAAETIVLIALLVVAAVWAAAERRDKARAAAKVQHEAEREMMRAISHYRHDWMNDLQVLMGYVTLKKYDKLASYLEKIKNKLSDESHIANIGNPSLSLLLMSYRLYSQNFELHVSLDKSVNLHTLPIRPERLVRVVKEGLQLFQEAAEPSSDEPNTLELTIVTTEEYAQFLYQYTGLYAREIEKSLAASTASWREEGLVCEYLIEDGQVDLTLQLQYE